MPKSLVLKDEYDTLNKEITEGLSTFIHVGRALARMKEGKVYREGGYKSFQEYCSAEHGFTDRHARRMITASEVAQLHGVTQQKAASKLAAVPEDDRKEVMRRVRERQEGEPTGEMIEDIDWEIRSERPSSQPDCRLFDEINTLITQAGRKLNELHSRPAGCHIRLTNARPSLINAITYIRSKRPSQECYSCDGTGTFTASRCKVCKGLGWITEEMWRNRPGESE